MTTMFGLVLRESCNPSLTASVIRGKSLGFEHQRTVTATLNFKTISTVSCAIN
jgi:hypothetical protein